MGQGNFPKFKIDEELGLLGPLHQRLYMEDPSAINNNDTNMMRASGESFSNFFDAIRPGVPVLRCRNHCKSIFNKEEEKGLREACFSICKSSCKALKCSVSPTRKSVCLSRDLNADCTPKVIASAEPEVPLTAASNGGNKSMGAAPQGATESTNKAASTSTNKTLLIVGVIVGVSVLGLIAYKAFKK